MLSEPDPVLYISLTDDTGKTLGAPIKVRLHAELSLRTAFMCALDLIGKKLKPAVTEALKGLGFK